MVLSLFRKAKWPLVLSFVALLVVGGSRGVDVGTDTKSYRILFELFSWDKASLYHANEPFYLLLQYLALKAGIGYEGLVFVTMFLTLAILYFVVVKWSDRPNFSILCYVLLYFYFNSFNTSRQYIAISFVLLSFYFIAHGNKKWGLVSVAIAILFHYYAFVALVVMLLLQKWEVKKKLLLVVLGITFLLGVTPAIQQLIHYSSGFIPMLSNFLGTVHEGRSELFSFSRLLLNIYVVFLLLVLREKDSMLTIFAVGVCMLNLFAFQPVVGRLAQYFTVIQIIIVPSIPEMAKQKKNVGIYTLISLVYMLVSWTYLIFSNVGEVVPWEMGELFLFIK